jgi:hypothetical protein
MSCASATLTRPFSRDCPPVPSPTSLPSDKQNRYAGLDDGFSKAFEVAFTPVIFCGIGFFVDRLAGTTPLFMIGLTVFSVVGMFVRLWYRYDESMKFEESKTLAARAETDRRHEESKHTPTFELSPEAPAIGQVLL